MSALQGGCWTSKVDFFTALTLPQVYAMADAGEAFCAKVHAHQLITIPAGMMAAFVLLDDEEHSVVRWGHAKQESLADVKAFCESLTTAYPHFSDGD